MSKTVTAIVVTGSVLAGLAGAVTLWGAIKAFRAAKA
jgi:hypothetical protein